MRTIEMSPKFMKDLKKVGKYDNFKSSKLSDMCNLLATGVKLPPNAKDHKMSSSSPEHYQGTRNFHVAPDICVIYTMDDSKLYLIRIGKHNNLGLTEHVTK